MPREVNQEVARDPRRLFTWTHYAVMEVLLNEREDPTSDEFEGLEVTRVLQRFAPTPVMHHLSELWESGLVKETDTDGLRVAITDEGVRAMKRWDALTKGKKRPTLEQANAENLRAATKQSREDQLADLQAVEEQARAERERIMAQLKNTPPSGKKFSNLDDDTGEPVIPAPKLRPRKPAAKGKRATKPKAKAG